MALFPNRLRFGHHVVLENNTRTETFSIGNEFFTFRPFVHTQRIEKEPKIEYFSNVTQRNYVCKRLKEVVQKHDTTTLGQVTASKVAFSIVNKENEQKLICVDDKVQTRF